MCLYTHAKTSILSFGKMLAACWGGFPKPFENRTMLVRLRTLRALMIGAKLKNVQCGFLLCIEFSFLSSYKRQTGKHMTLMLCLCRLFMETASGKGTDLKRRQEIIHQARNSETVSIRRKKSQMKQKNPC